MKNLEVDDYKVMVCVLAIAWAKATLSWDTMLRMTKFELDLVSDTDKCLCFEKCMRGGFSYISKWCSTAKNKYLLSNDHGN